MINHISVRIAWHNDGWNGCICKKPKENTYCIGPHSYPGEMIAEARDIKWESQEKVAGHSCAKLENIPPCIYSINAFGMEQLRAYADPPSWFNDGSKRRYWDLPPSTTCVWPYEEMYTEDVKHPEGKGQKYDNEKRMERAKQFFSKLTPDKSLIFYYANYSNPFSEDESKKYVIVGISRLKTIGNYNFYEGVSEENKKKYAGGFVWQMPVTSHYPDEGFRIPYHLYLNKPEINDILLVPENDRNFKYAARHISDDDALDLVERFLEIVKRLIEIGDRSENWVARRDWLQVLIAELWQSRGAFPGLPKVLDYLGFNAAIEYFKNESSKSMEKEAKETIFSFLGGAGKSTLAHDMKLSEEAKNKVQRQWALKSSDEKHLLKDIFLRFDISRDQIKKIISSDRENSSITASLGEIGDNPYILSEQFIGDNPDDRIPFNKIDHGILPSPETELKSLSEKDGWRRFRALCVDALRKESKHTFLSVDKLLNNINHRLSFFPEWKRHEFSERYFDVDVAHLSGALELRDEDGRKHAYLKTDYEDERIIERAIRVLTARKNIKFKSPVSEKHWENFLYNSTSIIAKIDSEEYKKIVKGQADVCEEIFSRPICVISGAAGTGKTTIIKAIINAIEKAQGGGTSFQLLTPTGKATDKIREITGKPAATIHSFLAQRGWLNNNLTFKRSKGRLERGISTYIIDESSMLDLDLAAALFRTIDWSSVQRLIFVGDPNQLPPIGKGKVFADIIEWLNSLGKENVGTLQFNIRQLENKLTDKGTGIMDIASLYIHDNDRPIDKIKAEKILKRVQEGGDIDKDLRVLYWRDTDHLEEMLLKTIVADMERDSKQTFNEKRPFEIWAAALKGSDGNLRADYQQVISPYRGELFGIENLNLIIQKYFNSHNLQGKGSLGGITYFDKVIQYVNRPRSNPHWAYNCKLRKSEKVEVYNGEIGFVKPHAYDKNWKMEGYHLNRFQVVFSRKSDYWIDFSSESVVENNIELAYAISVHKAQGSEFERIYFVLPKNKKSLLSTELLYTGITRARKHLTIFVEEDMSPLISLRRRERSHLLGINSSLFEFRPVPDELLNMRSWYEEGRIHQTLSEYMVRSKSEVIIANILFDRGIDFKYEYPLFAPNGTFYLPDFTIMWNGEEWYWEHLGIMNKPEYKKHWKEKEAWYKKYFPGKVVVTEESGGLSKDAQKIIRKCFSVSEKSAPKAGRRKNRRR